MKCRLSGAIVPKVCLRTCGASIATSMPPHQPSQTIVSQMDQLSKLTPQTVGVGLRVTAQMPGIHNSSKNGAMKRNHRMTMFLETIIK